MERKNPFLNLEDRPLPSSGARPLEVGLLRGTAVESRHRVHAAVYRAGEGIVEHWGDTQLPLFPRSSIKIMQALLWVAPQFYKKWNLGQAEMAIACGSHYGEDFHVDTVRAWLGKLGLSESALECGAHDPYDDKASHALIRQGLAPSQLHNNCSGKHAGILTACLAEDWPIEGYSNFDHPAQAKIRELLGMVMGKDLNAAAWGIDGCGIPTYSVPLENLAIAMAHAANPAQLPQEIRAALTLLNQAIAAKSEYMGGTESLCTKVVAETEGRVLAKVGAEGIYGAWIPSAEIGVAIKCEDGSARAAEAALAAVLREVGFPIGSYSSLVRRWGGEVVGQFFCS